MTLGEMWNAIKEHPLPWKYVPSGITGIEDANGEAFIEHISETSAKLIIDSVIFYIKDAEQGCD